MDLKPKYIPLLVKTSQFFGVVFLNKQMKVSCLYPIVIIIMKVYIKYKKSLYIHTYYNTHQKPEICEISP